MSDFKSTNILTSSAELSTTARGNPMIGFRRRIRYVAPESTTASSSSVGAEARPRQHGLTNVEVMIPFVRNACEAKQVIAILEKNGLKARRQGLRLS